VHSKKELAGAYAPHRPIDPYAEKPASGRKTPIVPCAVAAFALAFAFAFAGLYMGQNASARTASLGTDEFDAFLTPATTSILRKTSLLTSPEVRQLEAELAMATQEIASGKSDFLVDESLVQDPSAEGRVLISAPTTGELDSTFEISREEKQKIIARRKFRLAEADCLARAIYFEARSESEVGQLAVAKVVLNRVKDPAYPKTICGVVYQGANRTNACQFSFACDGISDQPGQRDAWDRSKRIAARALAGEQSIKILGAATYYHADYVSPKWSSSFKRLIKIGRHIFYSDS
jgi:spore germination cell wall hydrolase CwlJ-like protein